jgi:carbon monoxide dehydrogenase subunit G
MHLSGETEIAATRQRVFDAVSNPSAAVAADDAGQATVEKVDDRHYRVTVTPAGAPIPMNVTLDLELTEVTAPSRVAATIAGVVMGGPVNGTGHIELAELGPKRTRASWEADATLGGLLGGFEPMLAGPLQGGAEQAFRSLKERLEAQEAAAG